jgi:hypothetical protein
VPVSAALWQLLCNAFNTVHYICRCPPVLWLVIACHLLQHCCDLLRLAAAGCCCPICGKGPSQAPLTRTDCCHQVVCDTNMRYQVGSYSRDICPRSHQRYTLRVSATRSLPSLLLQKHQPGCKLHV